MMKNLIICSFYQIFMVCTICGRYGNFDRSIYFFIFLFYLISNRSTVYSIS